MLKNMKNKSVIAIIHNFLNSLILILGILMFIVSHTHSDGTKIITAIVILSIGNILLRIITFFSKYKKR